MKRWFGLTLVAGFSAANLACVTIAARQAQSVSQGVYTNEQANRGKVLYHETCESCHAPDLAGGKVVREIVGETFIARWNGLTVGHLFERVLVSMPEDAPSSVSGQDKADIVAYILQANGFPAGDEELGARIETLNQFAFDAVTP